MPGSRSPRFFKPKIRCRYTKSPYESIGRSILQDPKFGYISTLSAMGPIRTGILSTVAWDNAGIASNDTSPSRMTIDGHQKLEVKNEETRNKKYESRLKICHFITSLTCGAL